MQILGNFFLFLALLALGAIFNLTFFNRMPSGDAGVGHAWASLLSMAAFWLCIALVAIFIGFIHGFEWLSIGRFAGSWMLVLSFLIMLIGANLGLEGKLGHSLPAYVSMVVTPVIMLLAFAVLVNPSFKIAIPADLVKWSLAAVLALNSLLLVSALLGMVVSKVGSITRQFSNELSSDDLTHIEHIDGCDASKGIRELFIYTSKFHHPKVQEKALAKIKSKPEWQVDLMDMLRTGRSDEAFKYLESHEVDDKALFLQPVYDGVLSLAKEMRQGLRNCWHQSHLRDDMFGWEVSLALRVLDKYQGMGLDFKPAVQELLEALKEPIQYDKPKFKVAVFINKWLKQH